MEINPKSELLMQPRVTFPLYAGITLARVWIIISLLEHARTSIRGREANLCCWKSRPKSHKTITPKIALSDRGEILDEVRGRNPILA